MVLATDVMMMMMIVTLGSSSSCLFDRNAKAQNRIEKAKHANRKLELGNATNMPNIYVFATRRPLSPLAKSDICNSEGPPLRLAAVGFCDIY